METTATSDKALTNASETADVVVKRVHIPQMPSVPPPRPPKESATYNSNSMKIVSVQIPGVSFKVDLYHKVKSKQRPYSI